MALPYEIAKAFALKWLPQAIVNRLKRSHYLKKVKDISVSDEPDPEQGLQWAARHDPPGTPAGTVRHCHDHGFP